MTLEHRRSSRPLASWRTLACSLLLSLVAASLGAQDAGRPRGRLFIVGGGTQPPALVKEFVDLAGGARARIVVFAMASASGLTSGEAKAADLRKLGATAINVHVNSTQANIDSVARLLDGATGIWFGGGDQSRLTAALRGTATERAIHRLYRDGAVIGGTSAGAAVMSAAMITGDEHFPGGRVPRDTSAEAFSTIARGNVVLDSGFALMSNAIVDQHFLRRKRHNRLVSLVLEHPVHLGVGIDESTAIIVEPDGTWRVAGASVAVVYDARRATITGAAVALGAAGMTMHVLPAGSRFDPARGAAALPPAAP